MFAGMRVVSIMRAKTAPRVSDQLIVQSERVRACGSWLSGHRPCESNLEEELLGHEWKDNAT